MQPRFRPELIAKRVHLHRHFNRICFAVSVSGFRPCRSPQTQTQALDALPAPINRQGNAHQANQQGEHPLGAGQLTKQVPRPWLAAPGSAISKISKAGNCYPPTTNGCGWTLALN